MTLREYYERRRGPVPDKDVLWNADDHFVFVTEVGGRYRYYVTHFVWWLKHRWWMKYRALAEVV